MADEKGQREPSMEEILASIRQIISEDGKDEAQRADAGEADRNEAEQEPAPLDLTQVVNEDGSVTQIADAEPAPIQRFEMESPSESTAQTEDLELVETPGQPTYEPSRAAPPQGPDELISPLSAESIGSAFARLTGQTRLRRHADAATVEGLIQELLRPMLKDWLDENLPRLVERLVREEIERIAKRIE